MSVELKEATPGSAPEAQTASPRAIRTRSTSVLPELIGIPLLLVSLVGLWWVFVEAYQVRSVILPTPPAVWEALVSGLTSGAYVDHILVTLYEIVAGFGLGAAIGLVLALVLSQVRILERIVHPLVVAFQSVPKIAVAPLFIIWFGFGPESKIALVSLITFFPVLVAGLTGFKSVERERLDVMRSLGASKWQTFSKLVLPGSLPFLFTGLEIALVHAMTATIVAEFLAGQSGLGVLIVQMQQVLDTASIFSILIILGVMGWVLVLLLATIRKRLVFWSADARRGRH